MELQKLNGLSCALTDLLRALVDRITLTPNDLGKLEIDLYGDLAGILTLAAKKKGPLGESGPLQ